MSLRKSRIRSFQVITDEELQRIAGAYKTIRMSWADLIDQSRVIHSGRPADTNRRRTIPLDVQGYDLRLEIRISLDDPNDISVILLLRTTVEGERVDRIIARYDCVGQHNMGVLGLDDLNGPHMHLLTERYQKQGMRDDIWAIPMEGSRLEDGLKALFGRFNLR